MTDDKDFKQVVRARARSRGKSYAAARRQLLLQLSTLAGGAGQQPAHWSVAGTKPGQYTHDIDPTEQFEGKPVARLTFSASGDPEGFGTTLQDFSGADFLGQRIRLTGVLRAHDVTGWTGMWIRVDGAGGTTLSFDNMHDRPLIGTTDWVPCELVVAVPDGSTGIAFGTLLEGSGSVSISDLAINKVDQSVPLAGAHTREPAAGPMNLGFTESTPNT